MCLGNKKFDIRTYVLVTSFKPLKIYKYNRGFCRFCFENYQSLNKNAKNPEKVLYSHLTNVSFQKNSAKYNSVHGGKWQIETFRLYMELNYGLHRTESIFAQFDNIYIASLMSAQTLMCSDKHCFELYGFDLMIDDEFKVWLIEINASPSLTTTTRVDKQLKKSLVNDLLNVVIPKTWLKGKANIGSATCKRIKVGGFDLLYDESRDSKFSKSGSKFKPKSKKTVFKNYF